MAKFMMLVKIMARRRNNEKPIKKKKRKRGRPKKKGPKRNRWKHWAYRHRVRKKRGRPTLPPRTFIIAPFRNGHQCGKCEKNCPKNAISFEKGTPKIDYGLCDSCGTCVEGCPTKVLVLL